MMVLEHVSVEHLSPATQKSLQAKLPRHVQEYDMSYHLSPSKSVVELRLLQREEKPDVYVHTNPDAYKRDVLASLSRDAEMNADDVTRQKSAVVPGRRQPVDAFFNDSHMNGNEVEGLEGLRELHEGLVDTYSDRSVLQKMLLSKSLQLYQDANSLLMLLPTILR
jgi:hypothetical protein